MVETIQGTLTHADQDEHDATTQELQKQAFPTQLSGRVEPIPLTYFSPNPYQPRLTMDPGALSGLVESMKSFGFIGHVEARYDPQVPGGRLQLVFGHRRLRAAELAGLTKVPTKIVDRNDEEMRRIAYIENTTSEKLTYWEEAIYFKAMQEGMKISIQAVADLTGKSKGYVQNRLDVLRLPEGSALREAAMASEIDMTSAVTLLNLFVTKKADINELESFVDRLKSGEMSADDLKQLRKARDAKLPEDTAITDFGGRIHTIPKPTTLPVAPEPIRELAVAEFKLQDAHQAVLDEQDPPGPVNPGQPLSRIFMDSTVFQKKTAQDWAKTVLDTMRGFMPHLTEYARKADLKTLSAEETAELHKHGETIIDLIMVE